eukprot:scaffold55259_cov58-Attheya_sp.AAC.1
MIRRRQAVLFFVSFAWFVLSYCDTTALRLSSSSTSSNKNKYMLRKLQAHTKYLDELDLLDPPPVLVVPTPTPTPTSTSTPTPGPSTSAPSHLPTVSHAPSRSPTVAPSVECTSDETGSFGVSTGNAIQITYNYEIETSTTDTNKLVDFIIPALEKAVSDKLVPLFFGGLNECGSNGERMLQQEQQHLQRRLRLVGLSGNPPDSEIDGGESVVCTAKLVRPKAGIVDDATSATTRNIFRNTVSSTKMCKVVEGKSTLYVVEYDRSAIGHVEKEQAVNAIKEGMDGDEFISSHPDIVNVHFIDNLDQYIVVQDVSDNTKEDDTDNTTSGWKSGTFPIFIAAVSSAILAFLFIFAYLCKRHIEKEDESLLDEGDDEYRNQTDQRII